MLYQSIKWGIISLLIILLIHYLYSFFKNTLTVPKVRYMPKNDRNNRNDKNDKNVENKKAIYKDCSEQETIMKNEMSDFLSKIKKKVKNVTKKNIKFNDHDSDVNSDEDEDTIKEDRRINLNDDTTENNENNENNEINEHDIVDEDLTEDNVNANDIGYDTYTSY